MNERKIKILFAIGRLSVGGAEKLLVRQLAALSHEQFDPRLITLFPENKDSLADRVVIDRCFGARSLFDIRAGIGLYRYLHREHFDVVVTSLFSANLLVRLIAILCGVPAIIAYEHNVYPDKHPWQIFVDRLLARRTRAIITDSEAARDFTAKQERIPFDTFVMLYIPPLLEEPSRSAADVRAELRIPNEATVILTVSRLVEEKGHVYLIDAVRRVLAAHADVFLVIVGWGPLEGLLKERVREFRLGDRVRIPGRMDIKDVLPIADLYIEPAVSTDLPVAVMEAMSVGKAVIATDISEIPVFIEDMRTGLLVPPKDAPRMAEAIERLLADRELRARLGRQAQERVQSFSLQEYMRAFEGLVVSLVDESHAR